LFLVGWGALALALTIVAFIFLFSARSAEAELDQQLDEAMRELRRLKSSNPTPDPKNIQAAEQERQRAESFVAAVKTRFAAPPEAKLDIAAFKRLLDNSVSDLRRGAAAAQVTVPPNNYAFTFAAQIRAVRFLPGTIEPLVARLEEVKALCQILYQARIHSLDGFRRVVITPDDLESSSDILTGRPTTNQVTGYVAHPYEITFTGFSSQLSAVLDGLLRSPRFFVVKNIAVEPVAGATNAPASPGPGFGMLRPPSPEDTTSDMPPPVVVAPVAQPRLAGAAARGGLQMVLNEKMLKLTLLVDAIIPGPKPAPAALPAGPGAPGEGAPPPE
jgi:hypothetical protein